MAEKEYIERGALLDYIDKRIPKLIASSDGKHIVYIETIREIIVKFPTADVAEVVRCKDCKWYKESKLLEPNKFCFRLKDRNGDPIGYNFSSNEFCSFGERKELDNDT